jgi:ribonuclease HI
VFQKLFEVSNNEAEYKALLHGLRLAVWHPRCWI